MLQHLHHVHPHYHTQTNELFLLVHGWRDGKFAVLKHVVTDVLASSDEPSPK